MEEIDIIELLKRVKEGKAPKKIEINGDIYTFFEENKYENDNDIEKLYEIQVGKAVWYWLKYNIINFNTKIKILDKLQKENEEYHRIKKELIRVNKKIYDVDTIDEFIETIDKLQKELDKKDKVINLMAKHIGDYGKVCTYNYGATRPEQWKEYFYKEAEEENE